jgi:hypothetical protein
LARSCISSESIYNEGHLDDVKMLEERGIEANDRGIAWKGCELGRGREHSCRLSRISKAWSGRVSPDLRTRNSVIVL